MELVIEKKARSGLGRMQATAREAIVARLRAIAANPLAHHANVQRMQGVKNGFRLRQGDWRAVYWLSFETNEMRVTKLDVRGKVYR